MTSVSSGYQIRIDDPALQAYLQQYPFASGPDPAQNKRARAAILQGLHRREPGALPKHVYLQPSEALLPSAETDRLQNFYRTLGFVPSRQRALLNDFAWEANFVPRSTKKVLVVGCGDGMELLSLRAVLPEANITAMDYRDSMSPGVKEIAQTTFLEGDMNAHFKQLPGGFELITLNHTMEHFYTPDETLATFFRLLAPGGVLLSTLPMDAIPGSPFFSKVERAAESKKVHPVDLVFLDAGHPWKTTPADLEGTLRRAGFGDIALYQRSEHLSRPVKGNRSRFNVRKKLSLALNALFFVAPRALFKLLPSEKAQGLFSRVLLAAERRVRFGSNNIKNRYSEEALVHAVKPA